MDDDGVFLVNNFKFVWEVQGGKPRRKKTHYRTDIPFHWHQNYSKEREPLLEDYSSEKENLTKIAERMCNTNFPLEMDSSVAMSIQRKFSTSVHDYLVSFHVFQKSKLFQNIRTVFEDIKLKITLQLSEEDSLISTKLEITLSAEKDDDTITEMFPRLAGFTTNRILGSGRSVNGNLTVQVSGRRKPRYMRVADTFNISDELMNGTGSDCVLVAENDKEFPCHMAILKLHSKVFATMLESKMTESVTRRVTLSKSLSESGLSALVKFLYRWDTGDARDNFGVAFELLQFGHQFEIKTLEQAMMVLFKKSCCKLKLSNGFVDMEDLLELFVFAQSVGEEYDSLAEAIMKVIKLRRSQLDGSEYFETLFKKNPDIAQKLCLMAFNS